MVSAADMSDSRGAEGTPRRDSSASGRLGVVDVRALRRTLTWSLDLCRRQQGLIESALAMIDAAVENET